MNSTTSETAQLDERSQQIVGIAERVRQRGHNSIRQEPADDLHPLLYSAHVAVTDGVVDCELRRLVGRKATSCITLGETRYPPSYPPTASGAQSRSPGWVCPGVRRRLPTHLASDWLAWRAQRSALTRTQDKAWPQAACSDLTLALWKPYTHSL